MTRAHDLAATWETLNGAEGFTVGRGRVVWDGADYPNENSRKVRAWRIMSTVFGPRCVVRYLDPSEPITVIRKGNEK